MCICTGIRGDAQKCEVLSLCGFLAESVSGEPYSGRGRRRSVFLSARVARLRAGLWPASEALSRRARTVRCLICAGRADCGHVGGAAMAGASLARAGTPGGARRWARRACRVADSAAADNMHPAGDDRDSLPVLWVHYGGRASRPCGPRGCAPHVACCGCGMCRVCSGAVRPAYAIGSPMA